MGELLTDGRYGSVIEVPQLIEVDGKWVFVIQSEKHLPTKVLFATGDYDGEAFVFDDAKEPFRPVDTGSDFLNPVTCEDNEGRKIIMAWMFSMKIMDVLHEDELICHKPSARDVLVKEGRTVP